MKRRTALKTLALGAALGTFGKPIFAEEPPKHKPVRVGGPVFISDADPEEWAQQHVNLRYRAAYAPNADINDKDRIKAIAESVKKRDLIIAEVGRWVNLMDANPENRAKNLQFVTEGLALADELDARCCVDIAGTFSEENWFGPHPKNVSEEFFHFAVENARKIIDAVKPKRTKFAYEIMGWAFPDSADHYLRLVKAIDRPGFGVHLDVCNMINSPDRFWNTTRLINEAFDKLGSMIVSAHAKDLKWVPEMNVHFVECVIGEGTIDFAAYLKRLASLPSDVPLMIEHMNGAEEYDRCKEHLFKVGADHGVRFS
ncbi:MAG: sugar phosphate isomerase/epimerase [Planctomycetaceae bacterium]|jgi:sugar phosphate isomerase/epimerase|nr:sugar phosphate isomerase/epimerase [Planctomycetaceae bacterium]